MWTHRRQDVPAEESPCEDRDGRCAGGEGLGKAIPAGTWAQASGLWNGEKHMPAAQPARGGFVTAAVAVALVWFVGPLDS